jgi:CRP/FNR family transcriptional regulator, nitrogen oxide reductase regulator
MLFEPMNARTSTSQAWDLGERIAFLGGASLFGQLPSAILEEVARRMRVKRVRRGAFVFLEGTPATSLNLLAQGRVKVIRETDEGHEVILRLIEPGEIFGGAGGWGEATYPASARSQEDTVVLQLAAESFSDLIAQQPAFALAVVHELSQRLRTAEARIRELQTERVERRIARVLLRLANKTGVKRGAGIEVPGPLTRQDLAELAGTTLSTASRTLSGWDQQGIVAAGREHVTILRPHQLVSIAEDIVSGSE